MELIQQMCAMCEDNFVFCGLNLIVEGNFTEMINGVKKITG
jgi:hypothetical protein